MHYHIMNEYISILCHFELVAKIDIASEYMHFPGRFIGQEDLHKTIICQLQVLSNKKISKKKSTK